MNNSLEIDTVDETNVAEHGFFCYKSKPKSPGYQKKLDWLRERFAEGLKIKILYENERTVGFIEYIHGEHTWRVVNAPGQLVIHCLWVVGRAKGKSYASRLLDECVEDALQQGKSGVVIVSSRGNWLAAKRYSLKMVLRKWVLRRLRSNCWSNRSMEAPRQPSPRIGSSGWLNTLQGRPSSMPTSVPTCQMRCSMPSISSLPGALKPGWSGWRAAQRSGLNLRPHMASSLWSSMASCFPITTWEGKSCASSTRNSFRNHIPFQII
jgi:hypothetical protein